MSKCGIKNIYINGVDFASTFQSVKWSETNEGINGTLSFETDIYNTSSFTYNAPVLIYNNDDELVFWGVARNDKPSYNTQSGVKTYNVRIIDYKVHYNDTTVNQYIPFASLKDALTTMFNRYYPSDTIVSIVDNGDFINGLSFAGYGFSQVIQELLKFSTSELVWTVGYDVGTSKVTHTISEAFTNKLTNTINTASLEVLQPFDPDMNEIKNTVTITAQEMTSKEKYEQEYFFYKEAISTEDIYQNAKVMIPCDMKPLNVQCFLIVGQHDGNYKNVMSASLIALPFAEFEGKDNSLAYVDTIAYMKNYMNTKTFTKQLEPNLLGKTSIDYEAGELIYKKYGDKFTIYYDKNPVNDRPETENGVFHIYTLKYLKDNLSLVSSVLGTGIDSNNLIGYLITYNTSYDVTETFVDDTSYTTYGNLRAEPIVKYFPDYSTFKAYGNLYVKVKSQIVEQGSIKLPIYLRGVRQYNSWPRVGDTVDITLPVYGTSYSDVKINAVDYEFEGDYCFCTVSTTAYRNNSLKKILNALNKMDAQLKHVKDQAVSITDNIEITIPLTFSILSVTALEIDDNDCTVSNEKTWEEVYTI